MQTILKLFAAIGGLASLALVLALAGLARGDLTAGLDSPVRGASLAQDQPAGEAAPAAPAAPAEPLTHALRWVHAFGAPHRVEAVAGLPGDALTLAFAVGPLVEGPGIVVSNLVEGSPAEQAGLRRGDILLSIDGQPVDAFGALWTALEDKAAGDSVTLEYQRGDAVLSGSARLEASGEVERAGLGIVPCGGLGLLPDAALAQVIQLDGSGLLDGESRIVDVVEGGAAAAAGLRAGDRILAIDGVALDPGEDLAERLADFAPGDRLSLSIERPGEDDAEPRTLEVTLVLGAHPEDPQRAFLGIHYASSLTIETQAGPHFGWRHGPDRSGGVFERFFHREAEGDADGGAAPDADGDADAEPDASVPAAPAAPAAEPAGRTR
ncbi:MAG: PDZ domain-containing protein [Chloroflexi bacterium]|nr:PDZ domain-containing protein [Chloroflexota bacterium]